MEKLEARKLRISGFSDEISSSLEEQMDAVKELGMTYMALRGIDGKNIGQFNLSLFKDEVYERLVENDIKVSALGSPIGKVFIQDEVGFLEQKAMLHDLCQIANLLKTPFIRIFSFYIPEGENPDVYQEKVLENLRGFIAIAKEYGVVLLHENEKDIFGDTKERCLTLFEQLDQTYFRGIFDFANFVQVGEDPRVCYDLLKDHLIDIHIKDAVKETGDTVLAGTGDGKIEEILKLFLNAGYEGFLTLEPHLVVFDSLKDLELKNVDEIIKEKRDLDGKTAYQMQRDALLKMLEHIG